jgi:hypothetical protein
VRRAAVGALGAWCGRCRGRREPREAAAGAGGGRWLPVPSVVARGELRVSSGGGGRGVAADGDAGGVQLGEAGRERMGGGAQEEGGRKWMGEMTSGPDVS